MHISSLSSLTPKINKTLFFLTFLASFFIFANSTYAAGEAWYDSSWSNRVQIAIDADNIDGTLVDFPVYVDLSDLPSGFHNTVRTSGCDIRMTQADGQTEVPFELVAQDGANNSGELFFLASNVSGINDTDFYLYFGNASSSCYVADEVYGSQAVWSQYSYVSHDGGATDSTEFGSNGIAVGGISSGDAGVMGIGTSFDGVDDEWDLPASTETFPVGDIDRTYQFWTKFNSTNSKPVLLEYGGASSGQLVRLELSEGSMVWRPYTYTDIESDPVYTMGDFQLVTVTYNSLSKEVSFYRNGADVGGGVFDGKLYATVGKYYSQQLGARVVGTNRLDGLLDEVRFKKNITSADQILAEFVNQNSASTFYTVGVVVGTGTATTSNFVSLADDVIDEIENSIEYLSVLPVYEDLMAKITKTYGKGRLVKSDRKLAKFKTFVTDGLGKILFSNSERQEIKSIIKDMQDILLDEG